MENVRSRLEKRRRMGSEGSRSRRSKTESRCPSTTDSSITVAEDLVSLHGFRSASGTLQPSRSVAGFGPAITDPAPAINHPAPDLRRSSSLCSSTTDTSITTTDFPTSLHGFHSASGRIFPSHSTAGQLFNRSPSQASFWDSEEVEVDGRAVGSVEDGIPELVAPFQQQLNRVLAEVSRVQKLVSELDQARIMGTRAVELWKTSLRQRLGRQRESQLARLSILRAEVSGGNKVVSQIGVKCGSCGKAAAGSFKLVSCGCRGVEMVREGVVACRGPGVASSSESGLVSYGEVRGVLEHLVAAAEKPKLKLRFVALRPIARSQLDRFLADQSSS